MSNPRIIASIILSFALTSCASETCQLAKKQEAGYRLDLIKAKEDYELYSDPKFNEEVLRGMVEPYSDNPQEVSSLTSLLNRKIEEITSSYEQLKEKLGRAEAASRIACKIF